MRIGGVPALAVCVATVTACVRASATSRDDKVTVIDIEASGECPACSDAQACSTDVARCIEKIADVCRHSRKGLDPLRLCDGVDAAHREKCQQDCRASMEATRFRSAVLECVNSATRQNGPTCRLGLGTDAGHTTTECERACREELERKGIKFPLRKGGD
jgi:hypothetical protein